jgi:hypothetical protein
MRLLVGVVAVLVAFAGRALPLAAQESAIKAKCATDWPDDYSMRAYCTEQQREAVATLNHTAGQMSSGVGAQIRTKCARDWPNDYTMRVYCESQQVEAVGALTGSGPGDVPSDVRQRIRQKCAADWPSDYTMRAYCEDQQVDGYRKVRD